MKKKIIVIFVLLFLIGAVFSVSGIIINNNKIFPNLYGNTLFVGGDGPGNYTSIQQAIDNASDGDTVFVYDDSSPYKERIIINKTLELVGEDKCNTIILDNGVTISALNVIFTGFTIQGDGIYISANSSIVYNNNFFSYGYQFGWGGIYIKSNYNTIYDNSFINCGILAIEYDSNIFDNTVNGKQLVYLNEASDKIFEDVGQVILNKCNNITIKNSFICNVLVGIEIFESENCYISGNLFTQNTFFCMIIANSSNNIITGNSFANKVIYNLGGGLFLSNCDKNTFSRNTFQNGIGNICFANSSDNNINKNNFYFEKRILNIIASGSVNNWQGNFWNRPRLLPYIILIFNPPKIIPSYEIDRRPALRPNYPYEDKVTQDIEIFESKTLNKDVYWDLFSPILNSYPMLKKHFKDLVLN